MSEFFFTVGFERKLDVGLLARLIGETRDLEVNVVEASLVGMLGPLVVDINHRRLQGDLPDRIGERLTSSFFASATSVFAGVDAATRLVRLRLPSLARFRCSSRPCDLTDLSAIVLVKTSMASIRTSKLGS